MSEAPVTYPLPPKIISIGVEDREGPTNNDGNQQTCTIFSKPTERGKEIGIRCVSTGFAGPSATFTTRGRLSKNEASCLPKAGLIARGPNALEKAVAYLKRQCLSNG